MLVGMDRCADPALVDADLDRLLPELYPDLRRLAAAAMRGERSGHTLQPTALVHEVYLRLAGRDVHWESRGHLLAIAARAMRRVLVDRARARAAARRGGGAVTITLGGFDPASPPAVDLLALDEVLARLAVTDQRMVTILELRCFAGQSVAATAAAVGVSEATVKRDMKIARAYVERELRGAAGGP